MVGPWHSTLEPFSRANINILLRFFSIYPSHGSALPLAAPRSMCLLLMGGFSSFSVNGRWLQYRSFISH
jgi:hypothetical protein